MFCIFFAITIFFLRYKWINLDLLDNGNIQIYFHSFLVVRSGEWSGVVFQLGLTESTVLSFYSYYTFLFLLICLLYSILCHPVPFYPLFCTPVSPSHLNVYGLLTCPALNLLWMLFIYLKKIFPIFIKLLQNHERITL